MTVQRKSRVIWITGLSGAGKTTLAKALLPLLPPHSLLLDGDEMREALALLAQGYDRESRERLAFTYARLCRLAAEQGITVVCATISMFHKVRTWNRQNLPGYYEIFLDVPHEERCKRDPKGLYEATENGRLENMAGCDIAVELPISPDMRITSKDGQFTEPHSLAKHIAKILLDEGK